MSSCIVPIKPSAAPLERLEASPLDRALQGAGNAGKRRARFEKGGLWRRPAFKRDFAMT